MHLQVYDCLPNHEDEQQENRLTGGLYDDPSENDCDVESGDARVGSEHLLGHGLLFVFSAAKEVPEKGKAMAYGQCQESPFQRSEDQGDRIDRTREPCMFPKEGVEKNAVPRTESSVVDEEERNHEGLFQGFGSRTGVGTDTCDAQGVVESDDEVLRPVESDDVDHLPVPEKDAENRQNIREYEKYARGPEAGRGFLNGSGRHKRDGVDSEGENKPE